MVRKLRNHGSEKRSCHSMGYNSRLDDLHAGVLSIKLKHIQEWTELRRKWAGRYSKGLAGWLDDDRKVHPCNFDRAYAGFEITMALCRSAVDGGQVALPLTDAADEIEMLRAYLEGRKVLPTAVNAREYEQSGAEVKLVSVRP